MKMDDSVLSTSPSCVASLLDSTEVFSSFHTGKRGNDSSKPLTLQEFCEQIPMAIHGRRERAVPVGSPMDPVMDLLRKLECQPEEWAKFAFINESRNYTRNLVATDNETYTLLLLCWNPMRESPIHDHPCDGCWLKVLRGRVHESRYEYTNTDGEESILHCTQEIKCTPGDVTFIEDSMGYHKVGNPGHEIAVTLHVYSPPFQRCRVWLDPADQPCTRQICLDSEYGKALGQT